MATMQPSLFGSNMTPEDMQQQLINQRAAEFAGQSQAQQLGTLGYKAGANLGGGLAKAFGVDTTDPMIKQAVQMRQMASQFDTTTPEGMAQFAQALQKVNPQAANQAALQAQAMAKTQSEITKNLREKESADPLQKIIQTGKYTPASVEKYQTTGKISDLDPIDKADPTALSETAEGIYLVNKISGQKIARIGSAPARGNQVNVSVDAKGEAEFVKELGKLDAKKVSEASTASGAAIDQLTTLKKMAEVTQRPVISGSLAEQRTDVSNFFNTIGLSSNTDKVKTANSQEYIKYSTGLVLDNLKKTGYNPSNADMKVVQSLIPRLETDPMARTELIKFMAEKASMVIQESSRLDQYAREHKGLSGYKPLVPEVTFGKIAPAGQYSGLSDSELAARIQRAQANKP